MELDDESLSITSFQRILRAGRGKAVNREWRLRRAGCKVAYGGSDEFFGIIEGRRRFVTPVSLPPSVGSPRSSRDEREYFLVSETLKWQISLSCIETGAQ
jgi:hypothetical protein